MKIAQLTKYGQLAASTRQRFDQYRPYLEAAGFETSSQPLLDDGYLRNLYRNGRRDPLKVLRRYVQRARWLMTARDVDVLWVHCEVFPYLPGFADTLIKMPGKPIVFDYDDAIFHSYDLNGSAIVRRVLANKLARTLSSADVALCGNRYLAEYAAKYCKEIRIVPTVVDVEQYASISSGHRGGAAHIGWIGTPSTWNDYMRPMLPLLTGIAETFGAHILAVGAGKDPAAHPLLEYRPWDEASEVAAIQNMDIGVMPLTDTPWARGKCGYKLIQYMACGLPVVASPVGVNSEIVEHGVNGFLAETEAEWHNALAALLQNPDLRRRMGAAGRAKVEEQYSLQVWGPQVATTLAEVARSGKELQSSGRSTISQRESDA